MQLVHQFAAVFKVIQTWQRDFQTGCDDTWMSWFTKIQHHSSAIKICNQTCDWLQHGVKQKLLLMEGCFTSWSGQDHEAASLSMTYLLNISMVPYQPATFQHTVPKALLPQRPCCFADFSIRPLQILKPFLHLLSSHHVSR